jgi:hypothetical protein
VKAINMKAQEHRPEAFKISDVMMLSRALQKSFNEVFNLDNNQHSAV